MAPPALDEDRCYRALLARDRRFDGRFFTGVETTGIYCRPICPARTPHRENERFFACAAAAESAGFRACRRCRPETAPGTPAWVGSPALVARALRLISAGALDDDDLEAFAARLGIGARHLGRLFTTHIGVAPGAIARARRAHLARRLLDESDLPLAEIAFAAGFASVRQFNHSMRASFGAPPSALRKRRPAAVAQPALSLRLSFRAPLDWRALLDFLAARATRGVEQVDGDAYRRTVRLGAGLGTLEVRPAAGASQLLLSVQLPGFDGVHQIVSRVRRLFDLDADPLPIAAQLARDPVLAASLARRPGLRVPGAWDPFEVAVRAVLGQQVTVRGASTLAGRLAERFGEPLGAAGRPGLSHLFPRPEALAGADLTAIGLPRARAAALRALARAVVDGELDLEAARGTQVLSAQLRAIPGIGDWTAQYVAMRAGGEPDAFPAGDLGLRRALARDGNPLAPGDVERLAEAWRPWRSYAAMHLWMQPRVTSPRRRSARPPARSGRRSPGRRAEVRSAPPPRAARSDPSGRPPPAACVRSRRSARAAASRCSPGRSRSPRC